MSDYIQVVTTTDQRETAERIASALVEHRLAACVQIVGPISSTYHWHGEVETAQEWQCWAKSRRELYNAIEQTISRLHPYEVPEILAIPVLTGMPITWHGWTEKSNSHCESRETAECITVAGHCTHRIADLHRAACHGAKTNSAPLAMSAKPTR